MNNLEEKYDIIVVGAGHAGCEAALAAARMGFETICFTVSMDSVALMPCNPNIGGSSKGHLVKEIDEVLFSQRQKVVLTLAIRGRLCTLLRSVTYC